MLLSVKYNELMCIYNSFLMGASKYANQIKEKAIQI